MAEGDDFDDLDLPVEPEPRPRMPGSDVEHMLRRLHEMVASARPMPLSTSVMVNRDEVLDLLDETIERLPDELRAARWLLKEREEYLAKVKREGEDILEQARTRAERMVQRTEVVKASEARARKIVEAATDDAARLKNEVRGLLRPEARELRDRARAHHQARRRRPAEAAGIAGHRRDPDQASRAGRRVPRGPGRLRPGPRLAACPIPSCGSG